MTVTSPHVRNALALLGFEVTLVLLLHRRSFDYPIAFSLVHLLGVILLLTSACVMKVRRQRSTARANQHSELLRQYLAEHAFGQSRAAEITEVIRYDASLVAQCFLDVFSSFKGDGRKRLSDVANHLGLTDRWQKGLRSRNAEVRHAAFVALNLIGAPFAESNVLAYLNASDPDLRIKAVEALLRTCDNSTVERLFNLALDQPLWVRMHLADGFRQHVRLLSAKALPAALASKTPNHCEAAIAFLRSWKCVVRLPDWESFMDSSGAPRFAELISILPLIASPEDGERQVLSALNHRDAKVKISATRVAARWQLHAAVDVLARLMRESDFAVAYASAYALIHLGDSGKSVLRNELLRSGLASARFALEALEYAETQRVAWEVI